MGCLGSLFFDGRCSCTGDSFVGRSDLYFDDFLTVSILVCETWLGGFKWERDFLSNGIVTLVIVCALLTVRLGV